MSGSRALLVFARNPVPGRVKTRLAPALGADGAYRVYLQLLRRALATVCAVPAATTSLWLDSGPPNTVMTSLLQRYPLPCHAQAGGDLGERMRAALNASLQHASRCVLVGSDCPELDPAYIQAAFDALDHVDLVIGPAADGGYVLVGASRPVDAIFDGIPWGTAEVLAATLWRAAAAGLRHRLLRPLHDIDTPADLAILDGLNLREHPDDD